MFPNVPLQASWGHFWAGPWNGFSLARAVFPVVRHSRMKCPHDIGRDSWVCGEQGILEMMNSPHEVGDEALTVWNPVVGRKRGGPWVRWLLLLSFLVLSVVCVCVLLLHVFLYL